MRIKSIVNDFCLRAKYPKNIAKTIGYTASVSPLAAVFFYAGNPLIGGATLLAGALLGAEKWDSAQSIRFKRAYERSMTRTYSQLDIQLGRLKKNPHDPAIAHFKNLISNKENETFKEAITKYNPGDVDIGLLLAHAVAEDNAGAVYVLTQLSNLNMHEHNTFQSLLYIVNNYRGDVRYNLCMDNFSAHLNAKNNDLQNNPHLS